MRLFIAAAVALAASSQAFLLPPEVSVADAELVQTLDFTAADSRLVELPCPGCPVQVKNRHGKVRVKTDKPNHLSLLFKIDHQDGVDRLLLNGYDLFPHSKSTTDQLSAPQIIEPHPHKKHKNKDAKHKKEMKDLKGRKGGVRHHEVLAPTLGFMASISTENIDSKGEAQFQKVNVNFQVIEIGDRLVDGIPSVQVTLIQHQGSLIIQDIEVVNRSPLKSIPMKQKQCDNALCEWLKYIEGKLGKPFKSCGGKNKQSGHGHALQSHHKMRPGHFRRPQRTWGGLFKKFATHILLPVFIGIAYGVGASLLGMLFGSFVIMTWRALFRRGSVRCGREGNKVVLADAIVPDEKQGLMDEENSPPAYEEEAAHESFENEEAPKA